MRRLSTLGSQGKGSYWSVIFRGVDCLLCCPRKQAYHGLQCLCQMHFPIRNRIFSSDSTRLAMLPIPCDDLVPPRRGWKSLDAAAVQRIRRTPHRTEQRVSGASIFERSALADDGGDVYAE